MLVTDERGGGVVPPGATCAPGLDNPVGNGGIHVFDVSDPTNVQYALQPDGKKAVFIGTSPTPSPTFCTVHVIEHVPGEQRIIAAYYDGGTKVIDYDIDENGRWTFDEVASYRLPGANTWASEVYKTVDNPDGTRTYSFASTSFALGEGTSRGIDVFTWTAMPNPLKQAVDEPVAEPGAGKGKGKGGKGKDGGPGKGGPKPGKGGSQQAPEPAPAEPASAQTTGDAGTDVLSARSIAATTPLLPAASSDALLLLAAGLLLPLAAGVRLLRRRGRVDAR
jgi:hypothetical protein